MPYEVVAGAVAQPGDLNQLVDILQRKTGQSETGKYWVGGSSYANGALINQYMESLSRGATPVSVVIDTVDHAASNCGAPAATSLTANGFQVFTAGTGVFTGAQVAGNFTINF